MKLRFLIASALMLLMADAASAQCCRDPFFDHSMNVQQRVLRLKDAVDLSPSQINSIVALFEAADAEYKVLLSMGLSEKDFYKMSKRVVKSEVQGLKKIITPEQRKAYKKMVDKEKKLNRGQRKYQPSR